jgi:hypothetical protein
MTDIEVPQVQVETPVPVPMPEEKLNIADSASLAFFTNPAYLTILQRKKLCQVKDNSEEIKFYRKRIIGLFKDLLKENDLIGTEIKEIHTMFVNAAVRYFEITDKKDIIQGQHQQMQGEEQIDTGMAAGQTPEDILNAIGGPDLFTVDEANDLMIRKTVAVASLANYVIHHKQDNSGNDLRIIPVKMEIDLKTKDLKTKGLPPKKMKKSKISTEDLSN